MKRRILDYPPCLALGLIVVGAVMNLSCAQKLQKPIEGPYSFSTEIVPGVHLLAMLPEGTELAPTYFGMCVYLIEGADGRDVLIDSGEKNQTNTLVQLLASKGVKPTDIEMVACTHAHSDHVGSCAFLQRHGAKIAIHQLAGEVVDSTPPFKDPQAGYSPSRGRTVEPFRPDVRFSDGDVLRAGDIELRVLHTPGHTPDSSCFVLNRQGKTILFAGDLNGWYIIEWGSDQKQMLASVRKARDAKADYVCLGHRVVTEDLPGYWEKLEQAVADGIFQLVDRHDYTSHTARSGTKLLQSRPDRID